MWKKGCRGHANPTCPDPLTMAKEVLVFNNSNIKFKRLWSLRPSVGYEKLLPWDRAVWVHQVATALHWYQ